MYDFILNMWVMGRIGSDKIQGYVDKTYITQAEADIILATKKIEV